MGSTNKTTNLELSQFLGTDKPSWVNDYNADMLAIDSAVGENVTDISTAQSRADSAYTLADNTASSVSSLSTQVSANTTDIATAQGNITTINSLIGNGTPTTTDQTIIGAINEINAKVTPADVTVTLNTSDWTNNNSWVEREGALVIIHLNVQGIPVNGKTMISALPAPRDIIYDYSTLLGVISLSSTGVLSVTSRASESEVFGRTTISYLTES